MSMDEQSGPYVSEDGLTMGRDFVIPDDVKQFAQPALAHRLLLDPSLWGSKKTENAVIDGVLDGIPVPVIHNKHA